MPHYRLAGGDGRFSSDEVGDPAPAHPQNARPHSHRLPAPPAALRGRVVVAAVAVGALAAAGAGQVLRTADLPDDGFDLFGDGRDAAAAFGLEGLAASPPHVVPVATVTDASAEAQKLVKSARVAAEVAEQQAEALRPEFVKPALGIFTSGFGGRWGTMHYGVDIANRIGTPIYAAAEGTVIDAGPASGFGLWVRIRLPDGTINVYGHVDSYSVRVGQHVRAGDQIARMGNRGFSTGPHLHFEVWDPSGRKIDPLPWLNERGITL